MQKDASGWVTFFLAAAAALALSFLLSGCASGRREPGSEGATGSWGACDRSRMVSVMLICRQTKTEPVSDSSH